MLVSLRNHRRIDALLFRRRDDLVVDVGDVARIDQALRTELMADQPRERVEDDGGPRIADMGASVDRRTAHIHGDPLAVHWDERALLARHGVVEADHSSSTFGLPLRVWYQSTIARPLALRSGKVRELVIQCGRSACGP